MKPVSRIRTPHFLWVVFALWATLAGSMSFLSYAAAPQRRRPPSPQSPRERLRARQNLPLQPGQLPAVDTARINPYDVPGLKRDRVLDPEELSQLAQNNVGPRSSRGAGQGSGPIFNATTPAPPNAPPPYFDLTTFPRPPIVGDSTLSHDLHPHYSPDQQTIWFASDRTDLNGTQAPPINARFHIYQMTSDGSAVQRITGTTLQDEINGDQIQPALNPQGTKLAYVHRPNPSTPFQLFLLDLNTGSRTRLSGVQGQPLNQNLVNVGRPSWSRGGNSIAVHAQRSNVGNDPFNIFTIDVINLGTRNVTLIAPGSALEAIEPAWLPFTDLISFASTGKSVLANGAFDPATATPNDHDIWRAHPLGPSSLNPFLRLTTGPAGADDRQPAWNRGTTSRFSGALAFASKGRSGSTYNVHWIRTAPEGGGTVVHELLTPDNDPLVAAVDPTLVNKTDEAYPTWSLGFGRVERIGYHANRLANLQPSLAPIILYPWDIVTGANRDVWTSDVQDVNPPTLLPFDEQTGEIVRAVDALGNKNGVAGSDFIIQAKLKDLGSGIDTVFIQIKDPDSASQDSQGLEHKLYGRNTFVGRVTGQPRLSHRIHRSIEFEAEGVSATDYSFYRGAERPDFIDLFGNQYGNDWDNYFVRVQVPTYLGGIDDAIAWTGESFGPPAGGRWLQLQDNGVFPDTAAGDGTFSATWRTPDAPSDFYLDVIAYDNAEDPLNATQRKNWIIYDNVGGLSTQPLIQRHQALGVMDHALGQKWLRAGTTSAPSARGFFRPFPAFRLGTESEVLDKPNAFDPTQDILPTEDNPGCAQILNAPIVDPTYAVLTTALDFIGGAEAITSTPAFSTLAPINQSCLTFSTYPHYNYDVWRILSKGPVPQQVVDDYTPRVEQQPLDILGTNFYPRLVPTRFILWHSPFTGDLWAGAGTILDINTQNSLRAFVARGGRLLVDGADVGWALTQNGAQLNHPFLVDVLGANYNGDDLGGEVTAANLAGVGDELIHDIFANQFRNNSSMPPCPFGMGENEPSQLITPFEFEPFNTSYTGDRNDGYPSSGLGNVGIMDGITARASGGNLTISQLYPDRVVVRQERLGSALPTVAQNENRVIYCGFGLQTMGRRYESMGDPTCTGTPPMVRLIVLNYKAKMGHAWACWFMSAELVGQVKDISDQPVPGAWVRLFSTGGQVGSAFTRADGFFIIRGLPHGGWGIQVDAPGFSSFQKAAGEGAHALQQVREDIRLTPAEPGSISGRVVDQFDIGVPGARILATLQASPLYPGQREFRATTDQNGDYRIERATVGTYDVNVEMPFPAAYDNPQPAVINNVVVQSAVETMGINFTMRALPAPLDVDVFEGLAGTRGPAIEGATVQLVQNGQPLPAFLGTTNAAGRVHFDDVPPGPTVAEVSAPGFRPKQVPFNMPATQQLEVLLDRDNRPRGSVFGTVKSAATGQPLELPRFAGLQVKLTQPGETFQRVATIQPFSTTPVPHNYRFDDVPDDTWDFVVDDPRFLPQTVTRATMAPQTTGVDFNLVGRPGVLQGEVRERLPGGGVGGPVANASVAIRPDGGGPAINVTTNAQGRYTTGTAIASGLYDITADHPIFLPGSVQDVLVAGNTTAPVILLDREPDQRVSGSIRSAVAPNPLISAALVELIRVSDGITVQSTISEAVETGNPPRNYIFPSVPVGDTYDVRASKSGFRPQTRRITVNPGAPVDRVDFLLEPAFTFQPGLHMFAPPEDYAGDTRALFGNPPGFNAAEWLPSQNRYAIYPESPTNQLRRGRGMFIRLTTSTAFTAGGTRAPGDFLLSLQEGWQIIGSGQPARVALLDIRVITELGDEISMQEAFDQGLILPDLVGWTGSAYVHNEQFLQPFRGYWIKAFRAVTLRIPETLLASTGAPALRYAGLSAAGRLRAEAEIGGLADVAAALAWAPGIDRVLAEVAGVGEPVRAALRRPCARRTRV